MLGGQCLPNIKMSISLQGNCCTVAAWYSWWMIFMYRMILETQINYSIIHKYFRLSRNICISDGWCTFSFSAQKLTTTTESHLFFFLVKPCHGNDLKLLPYETKNTFVCVCVGLSKRFAYKCSVWIKISTIYHLKIKLKIYYCEISERRFQQN